MYGSSEDMQKAIDMGLKEGMASTLERSMSCFWIGHFTRECGAVSMRLKADGPDRQLTAGNVRVREPFIQRRAGARFSMQTVTSNGLFSAAGERRPWSSCPPALPFAADPHCS